MDWLKGKLIKKGDWYQVEYQKSKFKTSRIDIPKTGIEINESWNGKEIEFRMVSGSVTNIRYEGEEIKTAKDKPNPISIKTTMAASDKKDFEPKKKEITKCINRKTNKLARAPYNFIPLNEKIAFESQQCAFDKYDEGRHTGYIEVEVNNLTPLFIRQVSDEQDSFGFGDRYGIPGSSFRGMIRTMCEILSFGKFGQHNDVRLYYRGTLLTMGSIKAGVMRYESGEYKIYPCSYDVTTIDRKIPNKIEVSEKDGNIVFTTGKFGNSYNKFVFYDIQSEAKYTLKENSRVYQEYVNDKSRSTVNIFEKAKSMRHPIFYQLDSNDKIDSIGFAKFHRIPYEKSISEHIPSELKGGETDLVQGLFGDNLSEDNMIASRLSFGDLMSDNAQVYDKAELLKILASPKPTTFQHYLEQKDTNKVCNWNSDANIRGFKMYWHKETLGGSVEMSWKERNGTQKTKSHTERVKPVKPGATFKGKIWFQNLSSIELGLLLMALEPNFTVKNGEKIAHKIGLAKPLGLGSIEVTITELRVFKMDRDGYFSSYAPSDEKQYKVVEKDSLKNYFDINCAQKLGLDGGSIWDTERLKELKAMMTYDKNEVDTTDWLNKTRYMEIERKQDNGSKKNEFKDRPVLPKPTEVKRKNNDEFI